MSNALSTAAAAYEAAAAAHQAAAEQECSLVNLVPQWANGNRRPWILEAVAALGHTPTEADHAAALVARRETLEVSKAAGDALYLLLLQEGVAYEVVDHSDRLKSRPYEVTPANLPYVKRSFVSAHGSHLHLARYASRAAAEKAAAAIIASELARLEA